MSLSTIIVEISHEESSIGDIRIIWNNRVTFSMISCKHDFSWTKEFHPIQIFWSITKGFQLINRSQTFVFILVNFFIFRKVKPFLEHCEDIFSSLVVNFNIIF